MYVDACFFWYKKRQKYIETDNEVNEINLRKLNKVYYNINIMAWIIDY